MLQVASAVGLQMTVAGLQPYTVYSLRYKACTSVGCTFSSSLLVTTLADAPTNMASPVVRNVTSAGVDLDWTLPSHPNGVIIG